MDTLHADKAMLKHLELDKQNFHRESLPGAGVSNRWQISHR